MAKKTSAALSALFLVVILGMFTLGLYLEWLIAGAP